MCRLYAFKASEPTRVKCSLVDAQNALLRQSLADLRGHPNAHGWGVSCYEDGKPQIEKYDTAAHEDCRFSAVAESLYGTTVLAHVRHATVGSYSAANCHPFAWGFWSFAHNGTLEGFDRLEPELLAETDADLRDARQGQTDSEVMFLWLLTRMRSIDGGQRFPDPPFNAVMDLLADSLKALDRRSRDTQPVEPSRLNFVLTNGRVLFATRFRNSLFRMEQDGNWTCDWCGRNHRHGKKSPAYRGVTIASEPISNRDWKPIRDASVIGVDETLALKVRRLK